MTTTKKNPISDVWTLADCEWRAAAPGLNPLRLPRARDCAENCNNSVSRCAKVSAIDVTAKAILERLDFGSRTPPICPFCHHSAHTPIAHSPAISWFPCNFVPKWPLIFLFTTIQSSGRVLHPPHPHFTRWRWSPSTEGQWAACSPHLLWSDSSKSRTLFHRSLSEMQLVRTVT
jgi:hypothetical protein